MDYIYDYWIYTGERSKRKRIAHYSSNAAPPSVGSKLNLNGYFPEPKGHEGVFTVTDIVDTPTFNKLTVAVTQKHMIEVYVKSDNS